MTNGAATLAQPPLKRHVAETTMITTSGGPAGNSPGLTSSSSSPPNALAALGSYNSAALPVLTSPHHQTFTTAPAYYQQGKFFCEFEAFRKTNIYWWFSSFW